jgi:hypothetical protein
MGIRSTAAISLVLGRLDSLPSLSRSFSGVELQRAVQQVKHFVTLTGGKEGARLLTLLTRERERSEPVAIVAKSSSSSKALAWNERTQRKSTALVISSPMLWKKEQLKQMLSSLTSPTSPAAVTVATIIHSLGSYLPQQILTFVETLVQCLTELDTMERFRAWFVLNWIQIYPLLRILSGVTLTPPSKDAARQQLLRTLAQHVRTQFAARADSQRLLNVRDLDVAIVERVMTTDDAGNVHRWLLELLQSTQYRESVGVIHDWLTVLTPQQWDAPSLALAFGAQPSTQQHSRSASSNSYLSALLIHQSAWSTMKFTFEWLLSSFKPVRTCAMQ